GISWHERILFRPALLPIPEHRVPATKAPARRRALFNV
ncbi:MAG: hypothetical protein AVDCRST_MAG26-2221, partial [uncultured Chloroflexia bacterium]